MNMNALNRFTSSARDAEHDRSGSVLKVFSFQGREQILTVHAWIAAGEYSARRYL